VDRQFLWRLEDEVSRAAYEINEKYHMGQADLRARRLLAAAMEQINNATQPPPLPEEKPMSVTGAKFLAEQIRNQLAEAKAQLTQAGEEMTGAVTELKGVADQATKQVQDIKAETADLKAALGLNSNGGPA
jgi:hypothetical protein